MALETAPELLVLAPLRIEAAALQRGVGRARKAPTRILRTGMGRRRATESVRRIRATRAQTLAVAGLCGAASPDLAPGQVLVASELRGTMGRIALPSASTLLASLARVGIRAQRVTLASVEGPVHGKERERLARAGVQAVDMESAWLHAAAGARPFAVLRVVVDAPGREWLRPGILLDALRALSVLSRVVQGLESWSQGAIEQNLSELGEAHCGAAEIHREPAPQRQGA